LAIGDCKVPDGREKMGMIIFDILAVPTYFIFEKTNSEV
jgi:hypothetical protein